MAENRSNVQGMASRDGEAWSAAFFEDFRAQLEAVKKLKERVSFLEASAGGMKAARIEAISHSGSHSDRTAISAECLIAERMKLEEATSSLAATAADVRRIFLTVKRSFPHNGKAAEVLEARCRGYSWAQVVSHTSCVSVGGARSVYFAVMDWLDAQGYAHAISGELREL